MGVEIEHKFLVSDEGWRAEISRSVVFRQGYLSSDPGCSVRVRIGGDEARLNIKSATIGVRRSEFEYAIPAGDASQILDELCAGPLVEKTRHFVRFAGREWEIDEFAGDNAGLVVAEIELEDEDEGFERPPWVGADVSGEPRYYNQRLAEYPYTRWSDAERSP